MFEKASKLKLRFPSKVGMLPLEDLWDLPLMSKTKASLNDVAQRVSKELKQEDNENFVDEEIVNSTDTLKLDLVKHVIKVRIEANKTRNEASAKNERKEVIRGIIAQKQNQELLDTPLEDLLKQLEED